MEKNQLRIIWINGAFGVGKTTISNLLKAKIINSIIFDPEIAGTMLNKIYPEEIKKDNFQDYIEWRNINNEILRKLIEGTDKIIIIPMTITNLNYYQEIVSGLDSKIICQFLLVADDNTLIDRLNSRNESDRWPYDQIYHCIGSFDSIDFGTRIDTNVMNLDAIVEVIIERIK
ncbi:AAA family ATPase [Macrococcoides bohemicum]|uniref:AAA family ATPase n=1 Tax=Macrococcoides bohemicum TaxID=1903056 RepID=UPI00165DCC5F|nr:AAA family ATPase [Macrococcus bohemicus]MBC9873245.1 AAA family ATPase [Macrococcus bohemicus]